MIGLEGKTLHSPRLCYKLLAEGNKPALAQILSDPAVTEPAGFRVAKTQEEFDAFFSGLTVYHTALGIYLKDTLDRKSTRLNSSHLWLSRMPSAA